MAYIYQSPIYQLTIYQPPHPPPTNQFPDLPPIYQTPPLMHIYHPSPSLPPRQQLYLHSHPSSPPLFPYTTLSHRSLVTTATAAEISFYTILSGGYQMSLQQ